MLITDTLPVNSIIEHGSVKRKKSEKMKENKCNLSSVSLTLQGLLRMQIVEAKLRKIVANTCDGFHKANILTLKV